MTSKPVRSKNRFLVFGAPAIEDAEIQEVVSSMKSGWLGTGPKVERFENEFKGYKGSGYAVAVNSCTAALHLSALAAGLKAGDEVITTAMTFAATVNAIIHAGATPVLVGSEPGTMNIDPEQVERRISGKTRAILPVHFAGRLPWVFVDRLERCASGRQFAKGCRRLAQNPRQRISNGANSDNVNARQGCCR